MRKSRIVAPVLWRSVIASAAIVGALIAAEQAQASRCPSFSAGAAYYSHVKARNVKRERAQDLLDKTMLTKNRKGRDH